MRKVLIVCLFLLSSLLSFARPSRDAYLFAYFSEAQPGLQFAYSYDGLQWQRVPTKGAVFLPDATSNFCFRDPSVCQGPDGTFHMVWTVGFKESFGYASSSDLVHWSQQRRIHVMEDDPACVNVWAPDLFFSPEDSLFYIIWASTVPGKHSFVADSKFEKGYNHRIYCVTTRDFVSFSPTRMFFNPDFSVIDATIARLDSRTLLLFMKNENPNPPEKNIRLSVSRSLNDGFPLSVSEPLTPSSIWVEGPTALRVGRFLYVYYDVYSHARYGAMRSRNGRRWTDVSGDCSFPQGMRHGTAFRVSRKLLDSLLEAAPQL